MTSPANAPTLVPTPAPIRWTAFLAAFILIVIVYGCAIWANLSFAVTNPKHYVYFPPFKAYHNANWNRHLGAEYFNIAQAMYAGEGFADVFYDRRHKADWRTGPTAWMPPVLPAILTALLWICDGDRDAVMAIVIFIQVNVLILTGLLAIGLALRTTNRLWVIGALIIFLIGLMSDFRMWFQVTHDHWLILLTLDILIAWVCWGAPLSRWYTAVPWGFFGGVCAMINPMVALGWAVLTVVMFIRDRGWRTFGIAVVMSILTLTPWMVRNYLVFGKLIPVKSNLAYELYQSQCLTPDGLLQGNVFGSHPYGSANRERHEYKRAGEIPYLEQKKELFWASVRKDPVEFVERVAARFIGATLWYMPLNRAPEANPWYVLWPSRLLHPLPFLAILVLVFSAFFQRLHWSQWVTIAIYFLYLMPYVAVSYYERYAMPLLGVKMLLVIWAADLVLTLFLMLLKWAWALLLGNLSPGGAKEVVEQPVKKPAKSNDKNGRAEGAAARTTHVKADDRKRGAAS